MSKTQQIASRLNEVFLNGTWIANTNFKAELENINWEQAVFKMGNLNSIALLTFHINYYLVGLLQVFNGGDLEIKDKFSFEMPLIQSSNDWEKLKNNFLLHATMFVAKVEQMDDAILDSTFVDEKYGTYARNLEGIIEHAYYHLGQIVLIRKMSNFSNE